MPKRLSKADRAAIEAAVRDFAEANTNVSANVVDIAVHDGEVRIRTGWRGSGAMARAGKGQVLAANKTGDSWIVTKVGNWIA